MHAALRQGPRLLDMSPQGSPKSQCQSAPPLEDPSRSCEEEEGPLFLLKPHLLGAKHLGHRGGKAKSMMKTKMNHHPKTRTSPWPF